MIASITASEARIAEAADALIEAQGFCTYETLAERLLLSKQRVSKALTPDILSRYGIAKLKKGPSVVLLAAY